MESNLSTGDGFIPEECRRAPLFCSQVCGTANHAASILSRQKLRHP
ncbi:hypothetical protein [Fibrobacter intestinalis]|nr:hypothetical protein [Fibrobacter sp. NR9]